MEKVERRERIAEATRLYDSGRYADAVTVFGDLLGEFEDDEKQSEEFAWYCGNYGSALAESGNLKMAEAMMNSSLLVYMALGETAEVARTHFNLGNVYRYMNSRQPMSDSYHAALDAYRAAGDRQGEAEALLALAQSMRAMGVSEVADEWLGELAKLADVVESNPLLRWSMLSQQAAAAHGRGDLATALERLRAALACLDTVADASYRRETENSILVVKNQLGMNVSEAELDSAAAAASADQGRRGIPEKSALARLYRDRGELAKAEELFDDCLAAIDQMRGQLDYAERFHLMESTAGIAHEYSALLLTDGKAEQALEVSERGMGRSLLDLMFRHQIKRQGGRRIRTATNGRLILDSPDIADIRAFCRDLGVHVLKILVGGDSSTAWFVDTDGQVEGWDATAALAPLSALLDVSIWAVFGGEAPSDQRTPVPGETLTAQPPPWEGRSRACWLTCTPHCSQRMCASGWRARRGGCSSSRTAITSTFRGPRSGRPAHRLVSAGISASRRRSAPQCNSTGGEMRRNGQALSRS